MSLKLFYIFTVAYRSFYKLSYTFHIIFQYLYMNLLE